MSPTVDYFAVGLIGGLLGFCELIARYRDEPFKAIVNVAAISYIALNLLSAVMALALLNIFGADFGIAATQEGRLRVTLILVGGLGAMAFFRSSFFTFKLAEQEVPLGPGLILQVLLTATDRQVDRNRAGPRAVHITEVMKGIDFDKAKVALPAYCFGLMQNVPAEEQTAIGAQVTKLGAGEIPPVVRSMLLGLLVLNVVGEAVLKAAIDSLGEEIRN